MSFINVTPTYFWFNISYHSTMPQCFSYFCTANPLLSCHKTPTCTINIFLTWPSLSFSQMLLGQKVWACGGFNKLDYFFLGFSTLWNKLTKSSLVFVDLPQISLNQLPNSHLYLEDFQLSNLYIFIKSPKQCWCLTAGLLRHFNYKQLTELHKK